MRSWKTPYHLIPLNLGKSSLHSSSIPSALFQEKPVKRTFKDRKLRKRTEIAVIVVTGAGVVPPGTVVIVG